MNPNLQRVFSPFGQDNVEALSQNFVSKSVHKSSKVFFVIIKILELDEDICKIELPNYSEGIWVHKVKDTYYFTYPIPIKRKGKTKSLLAYCTSQSPYGPFEYHGTFFDNDSYNSHHSIIKIHEKWYLFYHIEGLSTYERRICVDYLEYNEDGTIKEVKMTKEGIEPIILLPIKQPCPAGKH